jgi:NADH-quinone oxidoreductase subunit N
MPPETSYVSQLFYQAPLLVCVVGACLLLLAEAFARGGQRGWLQKLSVLVCVVGLVSTWLVWKDVDASGPRNLFDGMVVADKFGLFLTMVFFATALLVTLISAEYFQAHAILYGELYPLLLFSTAGMIMVATAGDLVMQLIGIETMSLGAYVLTGSFRRHRRSAEAAMKYFLTGAFASGFLVYGIALVYGATGTTNLAGIAAATAAHGDPLYVVGQFFLIVALGFKIAAAPFHMWAPDAYEGAPTPVTGFMAAGIKAAGIAAVMRIFLVAFGGAVVPFGRLGWTSIFSVLAVLTMTIGNLAALRQENVKRMLAYSSIAHAGYLLVGVIAAGMALDPASDSARPALLFYLAAYTFTTLGTFGVVAWVGTRGDERPLVDDWAGLASRSPGAALAMTLFLLSLAGFPPTAGFFGKFYVFQAAMGADDQLLWLVVVAIVNSLISVFYYLRLIVAMYFREPGRDIEPLRSPTLVAAMVICACFVLAMGLLPSAWLSLAQAAAMFTGR